MDESVYGGLLDESTADNIYSAVDTSPSYAEPLNTTTLIAALSANKENPNLALHREDMDRVRSMLAAGDERILRNKAAADNMMEEASALQTLKGRVTQNPEAAATVDAAYRRVVTADLEAKSRTALEERAAKRMEELAVSDPTQAKVLMNRYDPAHGGAENVMQRNNIAMLQLSQLAEQLDREYQQQGWGSYILSGILNMVNLNYNAARSGIIPNSGENWFDFIFSGEGINKQSQTMWNNILNMSDEERAKYLAPDGELMKSIRDNATSTFDIFNDPEAGRDILGELISQSSNDRAYSNLWSGLEAGTLPIWSRLGSATEALVRSGARKEAAALTKAAADDLEKVGANTVKDSMGVTPEEVVQNQSIKSVDATASTDHSVPLSSDIAAIEAQARADLAEMMAERAAPITDRMTDAADLAAAREAAKEELLSRIGRKEKDVKITFGQREYSLGAINHTIEVTLGKKAGGGYATEGAAARELKKQGLDQFSGESFRAVDGQWYNRVKMDIPETGFAVPLNAPAQGWLSQSFGRFFRSSARLTDESLQGKALLSGNTVRRITTTILQALEKSQGRLAKHELQNVEQIALEGQNRSKWWTREEFNILTQKRANRAATEAEWEAYSEFQRFNNVDYILRKDNDELANRVNGYERTVFSDGMGGIIDTDGIVNSAAKDVPPERIYNVSDDIHYVHGGKSLTSAELQNFIKNGYVLVKTKGAIKVKGGITVDRILIKKSDIEISPYQSRLGYKAGGHRLYTDKYFVKQGMSGTQPDNGSKFLLEPKTFVTGKNLNEVKAWANKMNEALALYKKSPKITAEELDDLVFKGEAGLPSGEDFIDDIVHGRISKEHPFEALFDRELPSVYNETKDVTRFLDPEEPGYNGYYRTTGRMYTSSKGDILRSTSGEIADTVNPYEATAQSLQQVTRQSGLYNYRQESISRFLTSFANDLEIPSNVSNPYQKFAESKPKPGISPARKEFILAQRDAIRNVLGFRTEADMRSEELWRSFAEAVLGKSKDGARAVASDAVWTLKNANPVSALRGFAMDMKLGMFNIGQLALQSSTMASTLALAPEYAFKTGLYPMWSIVIRQGDKATIEQLAQRGVWKDMGFKDISEFKQYAEDMYKSGFLDMNGAHLQVNDFGSNAVFSSGFDKVCNMGRLPWYSAEVMNRMTAFRVGYGETLKKLPRSDPRFMAEVSRLAEDFSFNMSHESSAYWQKGVWSIPTQFWSYNMRMLDAMVGKRFTAQQKINLFLVNSLMAGSAATPVGAAITTYLKEEHGTDAKDDMLLSTLDRGVLDTVIREATGADVIIGQRLGTGGFMIDTIKDLFGMGDYGEKSTAEMLTGATGSILKNAFGPISDVIRWSFAESGGEGDVPMTKDAFTRMFMEISSLSNFTKAYILDQHGIYKSNRGTLYTDSPSESAAFVALGFRPAEIDRTALRMKYMKNRNETVNELASQIMKWKQEAFLRPDTMEDNLKKTNAVMQMLEPDIRKKVQEKMRRMNENESINQRVLEKYNETLTEEGVQQ